MGGLRRASALFTFFLLFSVLMGGCSAIAGLGQFVKDNCTDGCEGGTDGGTGMKPSDKYAVPLCQIPCHDRQHHVGELTFWGELGIDPLNVSLRLWTVSCDLEAGRRIIERSLLTRGIN